MATQPPRHEFERVVRRVRNEFTAVHALLLVGSFAAGVILEWVRSLPFSARWGWRTDTFAVLVAVWLGACLMARWPHLKERMIPRIAALLLIVLFVGTLVAHELINH